MTLGRLSFWLSLTCWVVVAVYIPFAKVVPSQLTDAVDLGMPIIAAFAFFSGIVGLFADKSKKYAVAGALISLPVFVLAVLPWILTAKEYMERSGH